MFFLFSKLLAFLIAPLGWAAALLICSVISRNPKYKKKFFISGIFVLIVFSNSFIQDEFIRAWEVPAVSISATEKYDVGIVLGGMLCYDSKLDRIQFFRSTDRLLQAVELYKTGKIKKILFSGGSGYILKPEEKEGTYVKRYLTELGIPESDLLIENESRNTRENAAFTKLLLKQIPGSKSYLLITSGIHMRRAMKCFAKAGIKVSPYSTDRYSGPRKFDLDQMIIPNASTLYNWEVFNHELFGTMAYLFAGYI